jgi:Holliday junction resolvase
MIVSGRTHRFTSAGELSVQSNRRTETVRTQRLGEFGETRVLRLLSQKGFTVEKMPKNFPLFDLMAKQGERSLLITVKTRNKFTARGDLKTDNYNLYVKKGHIESIEKIAHFFGAEIAWAAVTVDTEAKVFCACMGDVRKLRSTKYIPMHPIRDVPGYERLAIDVYDGAILESWSNIVVARHAASTPLPCPKVAP